LHYSLPITGVKPRPQISPNEKSAPGVLAQPAISSASTAMLRRTRLVELEVRLAHDLARVGKCIGDHLAVGLGRVANRRRGGGVEALHHLGVLQCRDERGMQA